MAHSNENQETRLSRKLNLSDALILGLSSMIGAGIFSVAGPAAAAAGSGLLFSLVVAGCIAFLNATTMAQLAALYPESGGAYAYGRKRLNSFWGFLAGWGFTIGKLASCSAMALTFAYYAMPDLARPLAVIAVLSFTWINYYGVKKTAFASKLLLTLVLFSLSFVVFASLAGGDPEMARLNPWSSLTSVQGVLEGAGLMFFAFAGYARLATVGEEVMEPAKTIPKAILLALMMTFAIYFIVIATTLLTLDIHQIADSEAPLALAVESGKLGFFSPLVRIGASLASLSVLISLMAGISRTVFSMSCQQDLPKFLSAVHPVHRVPHRAELMVGAFVALVLLFADLRSSIGFSSFAILIYYAIANFAAWTLPKEKRLWPRWLSLAGFVSCLTIAFHLPKASILSGLLLFVLGAALYGALHLKKKRVSQNP